MAKWIASTTNKYTMTTANHQIVNKAWNFAHVPRDDGL